MTKTRRKLVLGLHESGKSTFIAALWHVVESDEVSSALRVHSLEGDRSHLNKLRAAWVRCESVGRTSQQAEKNVRMLLEDRAEGGVTELWLPDMSGETFRDYWVSRQWPKTFDDLVQEADGALVFVHPKQIDQPIRIDSVAGLAGALPFVDLAPEMPSAPSLWNPRKAPTQVQLVDLLQFVMSRRSSADFRVTLIVSAWDAVRSLKKTPREWCAICLPLLAQFLDSHTESLRVRYFGVSAQGGALPQDATSLREITHASERIEVVDEQMSLSHDITLPIQSLVYEEL